jgi:hypothetical protein
VYGCFPFEGHTKDELLLNISSKTMTEPSTNSPLKVIISAELKHELDKMLSFRPEDRPSIAKIAALPIFSFSMQTSLSEHGIPLPTKLGKRYWIIEPSKLIYRYDQYYEEACYLAFDTK